MSEHFGLTALRKRATAYVVAGLGASAAAVISFSAALYDAALPEQLPVAKAGQPVDTGRWNVILLDARFGKDTIASAAGKPPQLAVRMEITNRSAMTSNAFTRVLTLENAPAGLGTPVFFLTRDDAIAFSLHPNMPERLIAKWDWPDGAAAPKTIAFSIAGQIHKRRDNLYGAPGWFDRPPVSRAVLKVTSEVSR